MSVSCSSCLGYYNIMPNGAHSTCLEGAIVASEIGGRVVRDAFLTGRMATRRKPDSSVVTDADVLAEKQIKSYLAERYPDIGFEGEETGGRRFGHEFFWRVDPIDGTENYVSGIPYFATSIALIGPAGAQLAVVWNPFTAQMFVAERARGAYLNGDRLDASNSRDGRFVRAAFSPDFFTKRSSSVVGALERLRCRCHRVLDSWAPTLDWCMLAAGYIDAIVQVSDRPLIDDSGPLIATEAGISVLTSPAELPSVGGHCWTVAMSGRANADVFSASFLTGEL